jgi:hypothetical protein
MEITEEHLNILVRFYTDYFVAVKNTLSKEDFGNLFNLFLKIIQIMKIKNVSGS